MPAHFVITRHASKPIAESYAEMFRSKEKGIEIRVVGLQVGAGIDIRPTGVHGAMTGPAPRTGRPRRRANPKHRDIIRIPKNQYRKKWGPVFTIKCPECGTMFDRQVSDTDEKSVTYPAEGRYPEHTTKSLFIAGEEQITMWDCPECTRTCYPRQVVGVSTGKPILGRSSHGFDQMG